VISQQKIISGQYSLQTQYSKVSGLKFKIIST